ncbi:MAG: cyclophilin-like fold protein [Desulfomonilaceae bacterium]
MTKKVMIMKIKINIGKMSMMADLNDSPTARKIFEVLPLTTSFNTWGDEFYFSIPVNSPLEETSKEVVEIGDLGYWPPGSAFCIFFGMTPMSSPGKIVPASAVNVIGKFLGDPRDFKMVMGESQVTVEPA